MPDSPFLERLPSSAWRVLRAFVAPDAGFTLPAGLVAGLLVAGVFLVGLGLVVASFGKGRAAKVWVPVGVAVGAVLAGWVLTGGRKEVALFFVVVALVLKFLAGVTFLVGFFRTPWIPLGLGLAVVLAAAGWVDAGLLGTAISLAASVLGAWSLYRKFEELSPGRRGSRWNQRTAAGWVVCLLAASLLEARGLAAWGTPVKVAGIVVGAALLLLLPRSLPRPSRPRR
jgi:hypothetical protein